MSQPKWVARLKEKWNLKSSFQVIIVLTVFACTGFTIFFIKRPLMQWLAGDAGNSAIGTILYYIFILPLYNILLLAYGFVFGQFDFFWQFEKRFFKRIGSKFKKPNKSV